MDVLDERIEARVAVGAANGEQRQLAVERNSRFQNVAGVRSSHVDPRRWPLPS